MIPPQISLAKMNNVDIALQMREQHVTFMVPMASLQNTPSCATWRILKVYIPTKVLTIFTTSSWGTTLQGFLHSLNVFDEQLNPASGGVSCFYSLETLISYQTVYLWSQSCPKIHLIQTVGMSSLASTLLTSPITGLRTRVQFVSHLIDLNV